MSTPRLPGDNVTNTPNCAAALTGWFRIGTLIDIWPYKFARRDAEAPASLPAGDPTATPW